MAIARRMCLHILRSTLHHMHTQPVGRAVRVQRGAICACHRGPNQREWLWRVYEARQPLHAVPPYVDCCTWLAQSDSACAML